MLDKTDMQTVRIIGIKNELDRILNEHYATDKERALVRPTIDLMIKNLRKKSTKRGY